MSALVEMCNAHDQEFIKVQAEFEICTSLFDDIHSTISYFFRFSAVQEQFTEVKALAGQLYAEIERTLDSANAGVRERFHSIPAVFPWLLASTLVRISDLSFAIERKDFMDGS